MAINLDKFQTLIQPQDVAEQTERVTNCECCFGTGVERLKNCGCCFGTGVEKDLQIVGVDLAQVLRKT